MAKFRTITIGLSGATGFLFAILMIEATRMLREAMISPATIRRCRGERANSQMRTIRYSRVKK